MAEKKTLEEMAGMPDRIRTQSRRALLVALPLLTALPVRAQGPQAGYPRRPVRVVVPYPPGGPNDLIARLLAQHLAEGLGQPFVIENRPGATGLTGTEAVAKSTPDGYTLLVSASVHVIYPSLFRRVSFDPIADFAGISLLGRAPLVLSVNPSLPVRSMAELIALAKSKPGQLQYASSGNGSATHLAAEALKSITGIDLQHIPYRGSAPAMTDVVAGNVQLVFDSVPSSLPFIKSGQLRALAVTSAQRSAAAPDLPSIGDTVPGYDISTWYGMWAPAGAPAEIVSRVSDGLRRILTAPDMRARLVELGVEPVGSTPDEFRAYMVSEKEKWARIVRASGAQLD
jgi:tripartite-type tricarboxylate transporter receptor subunit TctC